MSYEILKQELKLKYDAFSVRRMTSCDNDEEALLTCVNQVFPYVAKRGAITLSAQTISCPGAAVGLALCDGLPNIPGGFGNFIASGAGPGFPPGECIKCDVLTAEEMLLNQPQNIMEGYCAVRVAPYSDAEEAEIVCLLATPDQLSALVSLFYYRKATYDNIITGIASGCAQSFRIPFGELSKESPKAVIGNLDFYSRKFLDANLLSFTVTATDFQHMCEDVPKSFLYAPNWNGIKERL